MDSILRRLFEFRDTIKLFHFQTKSYGAHKAADQLEKKFSELLDDFMEVLQGSEGKRIGASSIQVTIPSLVSKTNALDYSTQFLKYLQQLISKFNKSGSADLSNILADMQAAVNQFLYLLTFK